MSEIFKLCYLKNNVIEKIHVHSGGDSRYAYPHTPEVEASPVAEAIPVV